MSVENFSSGVYQQTKPEGELTVEAEMLVIGAILQKPESLRTLDLSRKDFLSTLWAKAYGACEDLSAAGSPIDIDLITVWEKLGEGWGERLEKAMQACYAPNNIAIYADRVKRGAVVRRVRSIGQHLIDATESTCFDVVDSVMAEMMQLKRSKMVTARHIKEVLADALNHIDEMFQNPDKLPGLSTGLIDLDETIGGLQPGLLYVVGGRPSMGKTGFMLSMALRAAVYEKAPVGIVTAEQSSVQLAIRMLSNMCRIDSIKLGRGQLNNDEWPRLTKEIGILSGTNILLDERTSPSVMDIARQAREWHYKHQIKVLFVDYLQIIRPANDRQPRVEQVGAITKGLRAIAKELNIPVVLLTQLNRNLENRPDRRPRMADIRESGEVEQDSDCIMGLYRDEVYNGESPAKGIVEIIVLKLRDGRIGTIQAAWRGQYYLFENLAKGY